MLFDISGITIDTLADELFTQKQVSVQVLRLDKIHPVVSGNKLFKLQYFLEETLSSGHKTLLTFGGAYSNHLVATAFACSALKIKSIGVVRGEMPVSISLTLQQCIAFGMQLKFISRDKYATKQEPDFLHELQNEFGKFLLVPEGGYHPSGARGASHIIDLIKDPPYTHICTAAGTATTLAGLLMASDPGQKIMAIPVVKGPSDINERIKYLLGDTTKIKQLEVLENYHFGGYAKKTAVLTGFMNHCWQRFRLPLDFIYTAKMLYAVIDAVKNDHFPKNSNIICIHTGGLQGNHSLPVDTLIY